MWGQKTRNDIGTFDGTTRQCLEYIDGIDKLEMLDVDPEKALMTVEEAYLNFYYKVEKAHCTHCSWIINQLMSDGVVNILDLVFISTNFGQTGGNKADVNGDGVVDIVDLVKVAGVLKNAATAPASYSQILTFTTTDGQTRIIQRYHSNSDTLFCCGSFWGIQKQGGKS